MIPAASLPVVAIAGRPNVGKSTLFNALTHTRDAIVADRPGVTRDRRYGIARTRGGRVYLLVDTGGIMSAAEGIEAQAQQQVRAALREAHVILLMADARTGLTGEDRDILVTLRKYDKPVLLIVNKIDGLDWELAQAEWFEVGLGTPLGIAAAHRRGLEQLQEAVAAALPDARFEGDRLSAPETTGALRLALIGRPNTGKSTLVNRLLGEERMIASAEPGTTRDSIAVTVSRDGQTYEILDTAGIRKRARIDDAVEKVSVIKALQSANDADLAIAMLDAQAGVVEQDAHLVGQVIDLGTPLIIAVNKWDGLDEDRRRRMLQALNRRLPFADFVPRVTISALHGSGLRELFQHIRSVCAAATREISSHRVTETIRQAAAGHPPPMVSGRRARLSYAHLGGRNPLRVVVHGHRTGSLPDSYRRYLLNQLRSSLELAGVPLLLDLRDGKNPYAGRKNPLTRRQQQKRRRLQRYARGKP